MDSGGRQVLLWTPAPLAPAKCVIEVWLLTLTPSVSHWALSNLREGVIFVEPSTLYNRGIFVLDKVCWTKFLTLSWSSKDYSLVVMRKPSHRFNLCSSQLGLHKQNPVLMTKWLTKRDINNEVRAQGAGKHQLPFPSWRGGLEELGVLLQIAKGLSCECGL